MFASGEEENCNPTRELVDWRNVGWGSNINRKCGKGNPFPHSGRPRGVDRQQNLRLLSSIAGYQTILPDKGTFAASSGPSGVTGVRAITLGLVFRSKTTRRPPVTEFQFYCQVSEEESGLGRPCALLTDNVCPQIVHPTNWRAPHSRFGLMSNAITQSIFHYRPA